MTHGSGWLRALVSRKLLLIPLSLGVLLVGVVWLVEAQPLYVDVYATGGNDGSSWFDAYTDLQAALEVAESGDEIWVAAGTYRPSVPADRDATFRLINGVALYGGFAGDEGERGDRDWTAHKSILSGDIGTPGDSSDNCCTVVTGCDHAVLDGFTITRGNADIELDGNNFPPTFGGGMANLGTSPTVRNCHFLDNAADSGGGMVNIGGSPEVTDCTFEGNTTVFYGGGMWNLVSAPTVTRCTFSENWAGEEGGGMSNDSDSDAFVSDCTFSDNAAALGGGMCNYAGSSPTVADCTFSDNLALFGGGMNNYKNSSPAVSGCDFNGNWAWLGGGMSNDTGSNPEVTGCLFDVNVAGWGAETKLSNSIGDDRSYAASRGRAVDAAEVEACTGGGMYNYDNCSPTVTDCTFSGNSADEGGGMSNEYGSHPTVTDCTFSGNSAWGDGGGMDNYDNSSPTVTGCAFSDNEAWYGGGMSNYVNCSPTVTDCTFSGNSAPEGGGMDNYYNCSPTVTDCTFSDNEATWGGGMDNYDSSSPTVTNCTFSDNEAIWGGGMDNYDSSSPTVTDCTFSGNSADEGGGMSNYENCSPTATHCTFTGNEAVWVSGRGRAYELGGGSRGSHRTFSRNGGYSRGGGMYNDESTPTVTHCTFTGNRALGVSSAGGAMCNVKSSPAVANCTVSGNEANNGGGMYNDYNSSPTVTNCTFYGNSGAGAGMHNNASNPTVKNTILAGNIPEDCYICANSTFNSLGYNLDSDGSCIKDGVNHDMTRSAPLLDPNLQDNGGPTKTHALLSGSPALDAIPSPDNYNGAPPTDQRGVVRPQGARCDIGAFERELKGDVNGDGSWDLLDVVLCQQIASGLVHGTAAQRAAADVNDDGDVDADDVTILSEYVVGIRTTLP